MIDKDELIDFLAKAVKLGLEALPDSKAYEYCWDECLSEEQEKVKGVRVQLIGALELYEGFKNATKTD